MNFSRRTLLLGLAGALFASAPAVAAAVEIGRWTPLVEAVRPAVMTQAALDIRLLPLQSILNTPHLEDMLAALPAKYQDNPAAFAALSEARQVAVLSRGAAAAGRRLDQEAAVLSAKVEAGAADEAVARRLGELNRKDSYLSPERREGVRGALKSLALQGMPAAREFFDQEKAMPGQFQDLTVENKAYPAVVMGEDSFTGWFGKGNFPNESDREAAYTGALEAAYRQGVRGYSMSPHPTLMKAIASFKSSHPDIRVVANPHFKSHYYVGDQSLWSPANLSRLIATVAAKLPESVRSASPIFKDADLSTRFSDAEIAQIHLDEKEYLERLDAFKKFSDFTIVGNLPFGFLAFIGRDDIIRRETALARSRGLVPLGISEGGGVSAKMLQGLDVAAVWMWANRTLQFPVPVDLPALLGGYGRPVTAFRVFEHPDGFAPAASLAFIRDNRKISSLVVGVDDKSQAAETFAKIREQLPHLWSN